MMSMGQIEAKDFTYVQVIWSSPDDFFVGRFLVGSPFKAEAKRRAELAIPRLFPGRGEPKTIHYYPRTYVAKARKLLDAGMTD